MPSWGKLVKPLAQKTGDLLEQMHLANRVREQAGGPSTSDLHRFGPQVEMNEFYSRLNRQEQDRYADFFADDDDPFNRTYEEILAGVQKYADKFHPGLKIVPDKYHTPATLATPGVHHRLGKRYDFIKKSQSYDTDNRIDREHYFATHAGTEAEKNLIRILRGEGYNPKRNDVSDPFGYTKPDIDLMYQIYNAYDQVPSAEVRNLTSRNSLPPGLWLFRGDPGGKPSIKRSGSNFELTRPASFSTDPLRAFRPPSGDYYALRLADRVRGARNFRNPEEHEVILNPARGRIRDQVYIPDFPTPRVFLGDVE